jgi:hypothetical protein
VCPDPDGCARLFHPSLEAGLGPGDCCECCGVEIGNTPRVPSRQEWRAAAHARAIRLAEDAAALHNIHAARPPTTGLELVGWSWEYPDGSYGLVRRGEAVGHRGQPARMRPLFAPTGKASEEPTMTDTTSGKDTP